MKARCYAPSCSNMYYQKDGIKVCDRWKNSFELFLADMGEIPGNDYSIERIDYMRDYCPDNCIWIPMKEQQKNRRNVPQYVYQGEKKCLKEWSRILGFNYDRVRERIRNGMSFEKAIEKDPYSKLVEINGKSKTVSEWCDFYGINSGTVYSRIHRGWNKKDAILKNQHDIVRHQSKG